MGSRIGKSLRAFGQTGGPIPKFRHQRNAQSHRLSQQRHSLARSLCRCAHGQCRGRRDACGNTRGSNRGTRTAERRCLMSMAGSKARLVGLTKELSLKWEDTKNYWRDAKAQEFERKYLQELFIGVDKTVGVVEKLDELLKKVQKDCE